MLTILSCTTCFDRCKTLFGTRRWSHTDGCYIDNTLNLSSSSSQTHNTSPPVNIAAVTNISLKFRYEDYCSFYVTSVLKGGRLTNGGIYVNSTVEVPPSCSVVDVAVIGANDGVIEDVEIAGAVYVQNSSFIKQLRLFRFLGTSSRFGSVTRASSSLTYFWLNQTAIGAVAGQITIQDCLKCSGQIGGETSEYFGANAGKFDTGGRFSKLTIELPISLLNSYSANKDLIQMAFEIADSRVQQFGVDTQLGNQFAIAEQGGIYSDCAESDENALLVAITDRIVQIHQKGLLNMQQIQCDDYYDLDLQQCANQCDGSKINFLNKLCYDPKHNGGKCFSHLYLLNNNCYLSIPYQLNAKTTSNEILQSCSPNLSLDDGTCHTSQTTCPPNYKLYQQGCFRKCPFNTVPNGDICVLPAQKSDCEPHQFYIMQQKQTTAQCSNHKCRYPLVDDGNQNCVSSCQSGFISLKLDALKSIYTAECVLSCPLGMVKQEYEIDEITHTIGYMCQFECKNGYINLKQVCIKIDYSAIDEYDCGEEKQLNTIFRTCVFCGDLSGQFWDEHKCTSECSAYNLSSTNQNNIQYNWQICEEIHDTQRCPYYYENEPSQILCVKSCSVNLNKFIDNDGRTCVNECIKKQYREIDNILSIEYQCDQQCNYYLHKSIMNHTDTFSCTICDSAYQVRHVNKVCDTMPCSIDVDGFNVFQLVDIRKYITCVQFGVSGCHFASVLADDAICQGNVCDGAYFDNMLIGQEAISFKSCATSNQDCPNNAQFADMQEQYKNTPKCIESCPQLRQYHTLVGQFYQCLESCHMTHLLPYSDSLECQQSCGEVDGSFIRVLYQHNNNYVCLRNGTSTQECEPNHGLYAVNTGQVTINTHSYTYCTSRCPENQLYNEYVESGQQNCVDSCQYDQALHTFEYGYVCVQKCPENAKYAQFTYNSYQCTVKCDTNHFKEEFENQLIQNLFCLLEKCDITTYYLMNTTDGSDMLQCVTTCPLEAKFYGSDRICVYECDFQQYPFVHQQLCLENCQNNGLFIDFPFNSFKCVQECELSVQITNQIGEQDRKCVLEIPYDMQYYLSIYGGTNQFLCVKLCPFYYYDQDSGRKVCLGDTQTQATKCPNISLEREQSTQCVQSCSGIDGNEGLLDYKYINRNQCVKSCNIYQNTTNQLMCLNSVSECSGLLETQHGMKWCHSDCDKSQNCEVCNKIKDKQFKFNNECFKKCVDISQQHARSQLNTQYDCFDNCSFQYNSTLDDNVCQQEYDQENKQNIGLIVGLVVLCSVIIIIIALGIYFGLKTKNKNQQKMNKNVVHSNVSSKDQKTIQKLRQRRSQNLKPILNSTDTKQKLTRIKALKPISHQQIAISIDQLSDLQFLEETMQQNE